MGKICRNQYPSVGSPDGVVRMALIGEAPGRDEESSGVPFIGSAGRELDRWIKPFFIRSQCFVGNCSQERPPDNELKNWFLDTANTIPNEKLAGWVEVLRQQLVEVKPNIAITFGRHATYLLTGKDGMMSKKGYYAGSVLPSTLVPGLKVMACPHPAWIIRGLFDLRPVVRVWMKRAKRQSTFPEYCPPERQLVVDPTLETVMYELDRLMEAPELAFDIETIPNTPIPYNHTLRPGIDLVYTPDILTCISFSDRKDWSISIPFSRAGGKHRWAASVEKEIWWKVIRLLGQEGTLKIAHNLMFDFLQLAGRKVFVAPPYYDTMTAHNRAYIDFTKKKLKHLQMNSLAFCTAFYTEEPFYKMDHKDENKLEKWRGADKEFWIYNAMDSAVLHEIKEATSNDLEEAGMTDLIKREMRVFKPLACMGLLGTRRDQDAVNELEKELVNEDGSGLIQLLQDELDKEVGYSLNLKSPNQMKKFLYCDLDLKPQYKRGSGGQPGKLTTDEGAIATLYQQTKNPVLRKLTELMRFKTFKQNSLADLIGLDGRTRTTYNQSKTSTARVSSTDAILGKGKNNQTVPSRTRPGEEIYNRMIKELKKTYIPDPGYTMWKKDYSQAEARVVDYLAEHLEAIEDYRNGIDTHCKTTAIIYDIDYKTVYEGYKNGDPEWKMKRNVGKPTKHGFNYKLGERRLSVELAKVGLDIPPKVCKQFLSALSVANPPILRWHAEIADTLSRTRTLTNCLGLRRQFLGIIDDETIREAVAFIPQSTVGMLMNWALERVYEETDILKVTDLLLQQHDAGIWQSPTELVEEHAAVVGEMMRIPLTIKGRELIIPSDLEIGPSWGELK